MQRRIAIVAFLLITATSAAPLARGDVDAGPVDLKPFEPLLTPWGTNHVLSREAPESWATKTITGRLADHQGMPLADSHLLLSRSDRYVEDLYLSNLAVSDREGRFRLRGDPLASRLMFAVGGETWGIELPANRTELMLRLPERQVVNFELARDIDLVGSRLYVSPVGEIDHQLHLRSTIEINLDESRRAQGRFPPGRFLVNAVKQLQNGLLSYSAHVTLAEFSVSAADGEIQRVRIGSPVGTRIVGHMERDAKALDPRDADLLIATIEVGAETGDEFEYRTYDAAIVDGEGNFTAGPVPEGPCLIRVESVDRPNARQEREEKPPLLLKHRVALAGAEVEVHIQNVIVPPSNPVAAVQYLLDSEMPRSRVIVTWSWSDVIYANLARLPDRAEAEAELIRILKDRRSPRGWRHKSAEALARFRPVTEQSRTALISHIVPEVQRTERISALGALGRMGADAVPSIDAIAEQSNDSDTGIRYAVLIALQEIVRKSNQRHPAAERIFLAGLDERDSQFRKWAVGCVGERKLADAVPRLRTLLDDPVGEVRAVAAWALWAIDGDAETTVRTMIEVLEGNDLRARREAAFYLQFFDARAAATLPILKTFASSPLEPPLNNADESLEYQIKSVAESAIQVIEASIAKKGELIND